MYYAAVESFLTFLTQKVTDNTQIVFPWDEIWMWNTENFDELTQLRFATWYTVINSVLICTFPDGVRGQNAKVKVSISKHGGL